MGDPPSVLLKAQLTTELQGQLPYTRSGQVNKCPSSAPVARGYFKISTAPAGVQLDMPSVYTKVRADNRLSRSMACRDCKSTCELFLRDSSFTQQNVSSSETAHRTLLLVAAVDVEPLLRLARSVCDCPHFRVSGVSL